MTPLQQVEANIDMIAAYHDARVAQGLPEELPSQEAAAVQRIMKLMSDLKSLQAKGATIRTGIKLGLLLDASRTYITTFMPTSKPF